MHKAMPIGVEDFCELRKGYYFVDKTRFIRQLLDEHSKVTLLTRPRRFGKTLTMSMLDWFFSIDKADKGHDLFAGLDIERAGASYMGACGQYPVVFLTFKDTNGLSWEMMQGLFSSYISMLFLRYTYLLDSPRVQDPLKKRFQQIVEMEADEARLSAALTLLMEMLRQHYGRQVILLIDEYDAPVQQAWENGFYRECIAFLKQLLGSALKSNDNLAFAVLTGVLRVAKESIFSDLNNLDVCSVLSTRYDDVIGFTSEEVTEMAHDLGREDRLPEIRRWYDGYHFGEVEIYNPWSVINFFRNDRFGDYWVNTSGNGILRALLEKADAQRIEALQTLLDGDTIQVTLNERVIYEDIGRDKSALYTILLLTGYLTTTTSVATRRNRYALRIPNKEIRDIYATEILNHMRQNSKSEAYRMYGGMG